MTVRPVPGLAFDLPASLVASAPPEYRGPVDGGVRMLVASGSGDLHHRRVRDLPRQLRAGDLLVLNASDTLPASMRGVTGTGEPVEVHLSTVDPSGGVAPPEALAGRNSGWIVEFRVPAGASSSPSQADRQGELVRFPGGATLRVSSAYQPAQHRLWRAELTTPVPLLGWLTDHGQPIRYPYVSGRWPLAAYRTPFGDTPGSAEMPSAGRALTPDVLQRVRARGAQVARVVLHCGVSSQENGEPPYAEWFSVPRSTARAVAAARSRGHRVIAVGTTVVRALETTGGQAGTGWTDLVVSPDRGVSVVDGILTGWHEPQGSHLMLLEALAGPDLLRASYLAALEYGYLWHEFGDLNLLLPEPDRAA